VSADPKTPEPDLSGQTLDRYHLLRRLGVGGMGAVYEAEHTRLRKRFAVKLLRYEFARNDLFRKRFLREARAASAISHPNVVAISDFGETEDDHVFFVMELLGGNDLQALLDAEKKLPWPRTREILLQVASALHAAHLQDIIHRDIKPSNVFLADVPGKGDEDFVKVLDFGIAKLSGNLGEATAKLTSTDEIFGTVAYMAPEMAMGINDDRRSDVYAVGVMMYRMLTGELPFTQGNAFQILSQHIHAPVPPPRSKDPSISAEVEAIVLKALAKSVDDRFASMEELGRALRRGSLEATEALGLHTAMLSGQPKLPSDPRTGSIDRTTPLPSLGVPMGPYEATTASSPIELGHADSAAIPTGHMAAGPSQPMAVGGSGPVGVPHAVPMAHSHPIAVPGSGPMAMYESSRPSHGRVPPAPRKGSLAWLAIPVLAVAVIAVGITLYMLDAKLDEAQVAVDASAAPPKSSETVTKPDADADAKLTPESKTLAPVEPTPSDLPPTSDVKSLAESGQDPKAGETPTDAEEPTSPPDEPPPETADTKPPAEPKPIKRPPSTTPKPSKPKTDQEVVASLRSKIVAKCKAAGTTKVKIEGVISSSGTVGSLLITPPDGVGACAKKIVSAAKFNPTLGTRSLPRGFSVEL
jgi:serine/threonine protein kinase